MKDNTREMFVCLLPGRERCLPGNWIVLPREKTESFLGKAQHVFLLKGLLVVTVIVALVWKQPGDVIIMTKSAEGRLEGGLIKPTWCS